jgi:hypothetical protein
MMMTKNDINYSSEQRVSKDGRSNDGYETNRKLIQSYHLMLKTSSKKSWGAFIDKLTNVLPTGSVLIIISIKKNNF